MSGVNVDPSADEGIGAQWKEDAGQHHFNPSAGLRKPRLGPCAIHMPHGFYSPLYLNPNSPFTLHRDKGNLFLYLQDLRLFPVQFEKRPGYYSRNTSTGVPMHHIGPHRLKRQVLFEYNAYCRYFADNTQCLFCGIMSERPVHDGHYQSHFVASPTEIAEVAVAAYEEDGCADL